MSIAIASFLVLIVITVVAIPILIRVVGEAGRTDRDEEESSEQDSSRHSGPGRE